VIGGEPKQADDTYRSLEAHRIIPLGSLGHYRRWPSRIACAQTFAILERLVSAVSLVTEEEIVAAMRLLWERMKLVVEPSGAVAAAPALYRHIGAEGRRVGIILSGAMWTWPRCPSLRVLLLRRPSDFCSDGSVAAEHQFTFTVIVVVDVIVPAVPVTTMG